MSFINTNIKKWNIEKYVVRITSRYNVVWESNKVTFLGNTIYQIFIKYLSIYLSNIYLKRNRKLSTLARVVKSFSFKSKCFFIKATIESQFTECLLVWILWWPGIIYALLATPDRMLSPVIFYQKSLFGAKSVTSVHF